MPGAVRSFGLHRHGLLRFGRFDEILSVEVEGLLHLSVFVFGGDGGGRLVRGLDLLEFGYELREPGRQGPEVEDVPGLLDGSRRIAGPQPRESEVGQVVGLDVPLDRPDPAVDLLVFGILPPGALEFLQSPDLVAGVHRFLRSPDAFIHEARRVGPGGELPQRHGPSWIWIS